jgi:hypothetical protein
MPSLVSLLSSVYMRRGSINIVVVKQRVVEKERVVDGC